MITGEVETMGKWQKSFFIVFILVGILILLSLTLLRAEPYSVLTGKVIGIRARMWLDVESEKDKAIVNFRIGRKTVYQPRRYPFVGERVKVEYLVHRGVPVAYTVTILDSKSQK